MYKKQILCLLITGILAHLSEVLNSLSVSHKNKLGLKSETYFKA